MNLKIQMICILGDNTTSSEWRRRKRSIGVRRPTMSWDYYVELLVVADAKMYQYHGDNLDNYVLTLFSTVIVHISCSIN